MGWAPYTSIAVPGDVTGDGRPDVVGVKSGVMYVFPNVGGRSLGARPSAADAWARRTPPSSARAATSAATASATWSSATGRPAASAIRTGQRRHASVATLGRFGGAARLDASCPPARWRASSQADVVGVGPAGTQLVVMAHNGLTNVAGLRHHEPEAARTPSMVLNAGDWNGDGKGDLITAGQRRATAWCCYPGLGNGKFGAGVVMSNGLEDVREPRRRRRRHRRRAA